MMPPEQDYGEVLQNEFVRARRKGSREALLLFIARHPDTEEARLARELLRTMPAAGPVLGGPDADILHDYDRAARRDTARAYRAFLARHPRHPLAEEARRRIAELTRTPP